MSALNPWFAIPTDLGSWRARTKTAFQAEIFALLLTMCKEEVSNYLKQTILICSDSKALQAICAPRRKSELVLECGDALEPDKKMINLVMVPRHTGKISGNERADELARSGPMGYCQGPKLLSGISRRYLTIENILLQSLVEGFGYPFENHEVISDSGYILSIHRIPSGIKRRQSNKRPIKKRVALFQHGLLSASDMWLFRGPKYDLPYTLADAGYDVWLSNMRGNIYSRAHKTLNPDRDPEYWDFSLQEVAYYDFPAVLDYILNLTRQENLYFIGHSIGSSVGMMFCSLRPEYNSKVKLHLALAPLVTHTITLAHKLLLAPVMPLMQVAITSRIYNVLPRRRHFSNLIEILCNDGMPTQSLCLSIMFLLMGQDYEQFNTTTIPEAFSYFPSGTSVYLAQQTWQFFSTGDFAALDYENELINLHKYNKTTPPIYNLSMVTHPISLHYGEGDLIVTRKDMDSIHKKLPNPVGIFPVPFKNFNHLDFIWANDVKKLVYDRLVMIMDKYR
ncbi:hypothetical protein NQ317_004082 [Molorchus minor]|uniref:RNase H type-1 domain-containing protein n=1 Tax=Molorchus minor TaxID=1323400 RepID=A0ABQ9JEW3_9CUCU|nr:hypothetical protein NQ317_004082 [Molorchus minor]